LIAFLQDFLNIDNEKAENLDEIFTYTKFQQTGFLPVIILSCFCHYVKKKFFWLW